MRNANSSAILVYLGLVVSTAPAAAQTLDAQQIRRQIDDLQKQLEFAQRTADKDQRVTQIGSARRVTGGSSTILRLYDVGDLFAVAPSYAAEHGGDLAPARRSLFPQSASEEFTGGFGNLGGFGSFGGAGGAGGPAFNIGHSDAGAAGSNSSMDDLIEAITATIAPETWDKTGGAGSISRLGNTLLVSNDVQTHEQIEALLTLFRKRWGMLRTVSVRAYWLWLAEPQLSGLLAEGAMPRKEQDPKSTPEVRAYGLVNADAWRKLLDSLQQPENKQPVGYRAVITCYNGQTVSTSSGSQSLIIGGASTSTTTDAAGKQPTTVTREVETHLVHEGVALQVKPVANTAGKTVILDVHSRVAQIRPPSGAAGQAKPAGADELATRLEHRSMAVHRLSTTLRVPTDRVILVGGMTHTEPPSSAQPNLYLFVETTVQELRNDQPAAPEPSAPKKD